MIDTKIHPEPAIQLEAVQIQGVEFPHLRQAHLLSQSFLHTKLALLLNGLFDISGLKSRHYSILGRCIEDANEGKANSVVSELCTYSRTLGMGPKLLKQIVCELQAVGLVTQDSQPEHVKLSDSLEQSRRSWIIKERVLNTKFIDANGKALKFVLKD